MNNTERQRAHKWADFHTLNAGQPVRNLPKNARDINMSCLIVIAEKQYHLRQYNKTAIKKGYSWLNTHNNEISNMSSDL